MNTPDWPKKIDESSSGIVSGIEPVSRCPVCLFFVNGLLDLGSVENPPFVDCLNKGEWMVEDICPLLNGINIILDTFAVLHGVWEHPDDGTDVFDTIDEVEVFEVIQSGLDLFEHGLGTFEAALELSKVVVACKSVDESSYEVWNCFHRREQHVLVSSVGILHGSVHLVGVHI